MWKKDEESDRPAPSESAHRVASPKPRAEPSPRATIGPSIRIKGDVTGSEDLLIQGEVDGSVTLGKHAVGVGSDGRVKANIVGRMITIEGSVEGDLTAQEQIVLRGSARVQGDIKAPRVVLEDGATFRGLVDMGTSTTTGDDRAVGETPGNADSGKSGAAGGASSSPKELRGQKSTGSGASDAVGGTGGKGEPAQAGPR